jgi:hypothetical protein
MFCLSIVPNLELRSVDLQLQGFLFGRPKTIIIKTTSTLHRPNLEIRSVDLQLQGDQNGL